MRSRLFCHSLESVAQHLERLAPERSRRRVLSVHTSEHRAAELEGFVDEARAVRTAGA